MPTRSIQAVTESLATDPAAPLKDVRLLNQAAAFPGADAVLAPFAKRVNAGLAASAHDAGRPVPTVTMAAGRVRVRGTLAGQAVEAWVLAMTITRTDPLPGGGSMTVQDTPLFATLYAPPGQLDAREKILSDLLDAVDVRPQWQAHADAFMVQVRHPFEVAIRNTNAMVADTARQIADIHAEIIADNAAAAAKQADIRRDAATYAGDVNANVAAGRAAALDHSDRQFSLYAGDQAVYHNADGTRVQLPGNFGHAWASTTGNTTDFIVTDSPSFNPNGVVGSASWGQLTPEH